MAPRFYGLPLNEGTVTLERTSQQVPETVDGLVPFHAGETLGWRAGGLGSADPLRAKDITEKTFDPIVTFA